MQKSNDGYSEFDNFDNKVNKMLGKFPVTINTVNAWKIFSRMCKSTLYRIDQEIANFESEVETGPNTR